MPTITIGQSVTYLAEIGGYRFVVPVPAIVKEIRGERAKIEATRKDGTVVNKWVKLNKLKERM